MTIDTPTPTSPATYHGIQFAKCLQCGYATADPTDLEFWNDLGAQCLSCDATEGRILWVLTGERVSITTSTDDHGLVSTDYLLGTDPALTGAPA